MNILAPILVNPHATATGPKRMRFWDQEGYFCSMAAQSCWHRFAMVSLSFELSCRSIVRRWALKSWHSWKNKSNSWADAWAPFRSLRFLMLWSASLTTGSSFTTIGARSTSWVAIALGWAGPLPEVHSLEHMWKLQVPLRRGEPGHVQIVPAVSAIIGFNRTNRVRHSQSRPCFVALKGTFFQTPTGCGHNAAAACWQTIEKYI